MFYRERVHRRDAENAEETTRRSLSQRSLRLCGESFYFVFTR